MNLDFGMQHEMSSPLLSFPLLVLNILRACNSVNEHFLKMIIQENGNYNDYGNYIDLAIGTTNDTKAMPKQCKSQPNGKNSGKKPRAFWKQ